jgi:hypothetical protein
MSDQKKRIEIPYDSKADGWVIPGGSTVIGFGDHIVGSPYPPVIVEVDDE